MGEAGDGDSFDNLEASACEGKTSLANLKEAGATAAPWNCRLPPALLLTFQMYTIRQLFTPVIGIGGSGLAL